MTTQQKKTQRKPSPKTNTRSFLEHIQELKTRFFVWFAFLIIASGIGYFLYPHLLDWLITPLNKPLYYTSPIGGFEAVFTVSVFFGFVTSIPVLLFQVIRFLAPTIKSLSVKSYLAITTTSLVLAVSGIALSYYLILPKALEFLNKFGGEQLSALISTSDYFSFITKYLVGFAILFQLPLVMYLVNKYHKLEVKKLLANFKYVFLVSFIISAILTPTPDMINQAIMAAPILVLYLISVLVVWISSWRLFSFAKQTKRHV